MDTEENGSFAIFHMRSAEAASRPSVERWLLGNASNYQLVALVEAPSQEEAFRLTSHLSETPWWRNPPILVWQPGRLSLVRNQRHLRGAAASDTSSTPSAHAQEAIPQTFAFPESMAPDEHPPRFTTIGDVLVSRSTHQAWFVMPTGLQEIHYSSPAPHISLSVGDAVTAIAFAPGGHTLATGTRNGFIGGWDLDKEELVFDYQLGTRSINWISFSPNGLQLAARSQNRWAGIWRNDERDNLSIELFRRIDPLYSGCWFRQEAAFISRPATPRSELWLTRLNARNLPDIQWRYHAAPSLLDGLDEAVVSPDGEKLAMLGDDPSPQLWHAPSGTSLSLAVPGFLAHTLTWSPDGAYLCAIADASSIVIWRVTDGAVQTRCTPSTYTDVRNAICGIAWSPHRQALAAAQIDGTVQIFSTVDGVHLFTHHGPLSSILSVDWSSDGRWLATGSDDGSISVLNVPEKIAMNK